MKPNVIIVGASEHGRVIADIIEKERLYTIAGFIDADPHKKTDLWNYRLLGNEEDLPAFYKKLNISFLFVAIGDNFVRFKVVQKIRKLIPEVTFATCIHPSAVIGKNVIIGNGTVIMPGAIINCNTKIREHCIINIRASLDHDNILADYCSVAPNVTTGGKVCIGLFSAIGLSASIIHGKTIGEHTVVGASSLILSDMESYKVVFGIPAKVVRQRIGGEKYL